MLESHPRKLTAAERRLLGAKIRDLKVKLKRGPRIYLIAATVFLFLWVVTLVVSGSPWLVVTLFWIIIGSGITIWVRLDMNRDLANLASMLRSFESALRADEAEVFDIKARAFANIEEVEDEGACYAFEIEGGRLVFITGQQFYEEAKFPSLDFSLVHVLNEQREVVDVLIEKRGPKSPPARTISATTKLGLEIPDHLAVIDGHLDEIEQLLDARGGGIG